MKKQKAFTIVEIMIVVLIIGGLMAVLVPRINKYLKDSKVKTTKLALESFKSDLEIYNTDYGNYPSSSDGLEAVIAEEKQLKDAFGTPFEYNAPPMRFKDRYQHYEVISYGPDKEESNDDIHVGH